MQRQLSKKGPLQNAVFRPKREIYALKVSENRHPDGSHSLFNGPIRQNSILQQAPLYAIRFDGCGLHNVQYL